jgi:hypothetical protein
MTPCIYVSDDSPNEQQLSKRLVMKNIDKFIDLWPLYIMLLFKQIFGI